MSSWSSSDTYYATITSASGLTAVLNGLHDGWVTVSATINGVTGYGSAEIRCVTTAGWSAPSDPVLTAVPGLLRVRISG